MGFPEVAERLMIMFGRTPQRVQWGVALIASLRQAATKRKLTDRALDVNLKARHVCKQADISSSDRASAKPKVGQHDIKRLHEHANILEDERIGDRAVFP